MKKLFVSMVLFISVTAQTKAPICLPPALESLFDQYTAGIEKEKNDSANMHIQTCCRNRTYTISSSSLEQIGLALIELNVKRFALFLELFGDKLSIEQKRSVLNALSIKINQMESTENLYPIILHACSFLVTGVASLLCFYASFQGGTFEKIKFLPGAAIFGALGCATAVRLIQELSLKSRKLLALKLREQVESAERVNRA